MKYLLYILALLPTCGYTSIIDTVPNTMRFGHVSSSWNGEEFADPSAGVTYLNPPSANVTGAANLSFPIKLPAGRQGVEPQLSISYDSEERTTWLGYGWNMDVSSITLDTRWGVPFFDQENESEVYVFDGELMGPVFHRAALYPRESERNFVLRQNTEFQTFIRHGDNTLNYWWEVTEPSGVKKFYGGIPETGATEAGTLRSEKGITHWFLLKTIDTNGNNIIYNYQQTNGITGINKYPSSIYYTGYESSMGNYSVHFTLDTEPRSDRTVSGRHGYLISEERLLHRIEVRFQEQQIRAYVLQYELGVFGKTLLHAIDVYDRENTFFYAYEFEYFDDLFQDGNLIAYSSSSSWEVTKEADIPVGNITGNIDGFNAKPTILGSALSTSEGGSLSVTVGPISQPHTKDYTVGPNGGFTNNKSEGLTALIDIDGDGLPDKLWKQDDGLYYRSNQLSADIPQESFGPAIKLNGVASFSKSSTGSWDLGAELNSLPVYAGYTHEEGTTRTSTYFADFNGDELIDIVSEGEVFFNYLDNGIPTFSNQVSLTGSMIYSGVGLDPSIVEFDPAEQAEQENQNPLHDAVRVWRAPFDGVVMIDAPVRLVEDNSAESMTYETKDGVRVSIQKENSLLWEADIAAQDFSLFTPTNVQSVDVNEGDFIYFRVHSIFDGSYDQVSWSPIITYIDSYDVMDANELAYNTYSAAEDFILEEEKPIVFNQEGVIQITSKLLKPLLTDDVEIRISGAYDHTWIVDMKDVVDSTWVISDIPVASQDEIIFSIRSQSNVDWSKITWEPAFEYTAFADGSPTVNDDGTPVYSGCAVVDYQGFFKNENLGRPVSIQNLDSLDVLIAFDASVILTYNVSVKLTGALDTTYNFQNSGFNFNQKVRVEGADKIFVDVHYKSQSDVLSLNIMNSSLNINGSDVEIDCGLWNDIELEDGTYGSLYRGWGQFLYNGNDGRGALPINLIGLELDEDELANDTLQVDENAENTDIEGTGNNGELIIAMTSDPKLMAWRGSDEFAFVGSLSMGSTRRGQKYIETGVFNTGSGDFFTSPELISRYYSNGGFGGFSVPGAPVNVGAGYTAATTYSVLDIADFNGDRYPDIVGEKFTQLTNVRGGLTENTLDYEWGIHEAFSEATSVGIGLNPGSTSAKNAGGSMGAGSSKSTVRFRQKGKANASKARSSFESASEAVGLSANVGVDVDRGIHTFLDMNGDGLEDKIWENGDVALNLGYSFASIENWDFNTIRSGGALDFGAGVGIDISNGSILGGVSATKTDNGSKTGFVDLNGDALLDIIVSSDPIMVRFNTGTGFTDPVEWLQLEEFDQGVALGESVNAGFTFSILIIFVKISFNVQGFLGQGTGSTYQSFQDINGDGYTDYLSAQSSDDNLTVRYSTIGRSNLLKTIHYPLGAELNLDYQVQGNQADLPYSLWTLSEVIMYDGLEGDGRDYMQAKFSYSDGFHDRHDRQFFGFGEVISVQLSGEKKEKELVQTYHVDNYYMKGLISSVELYDANDRLHKSIDFNYTLRDIETGIILPANYVTKDDGMAFPSLTQEIVVFTEGSLDKSLEVNYLFDYDSLGNLTKQIESDVNDYYKEIRWKYKTDFENGITDRVQEELVFGGSQLISESNYSYDNKGNRLETNEKIEAGVFATTNFAYDIYGNERKVINPENINGERLEVDFMYDSQNNQFLTSRIDNYGYQENYSYEALYGTITEHVDKNGNIYTYGIDEKGRPAYALNPFDYVDNKIYSITYDYFHDANTPYAVCNHRDPNTDLDIQTFSFSDGTHNIVQTKVPSIISVNNNEQAVYIVSGKILKDSLGRVTREYLTTTEPMGAQSIYNPSTSVVPPKVYTYDLLDRFLSVIQVDGGETQFSYDIKEDNGQSQLRVTQSNPNGLVIENLYSSRGELLEEKRMMSSEISSTKYEYDELSFLTKITHPSGFETNYGYDLLGRRISVDVPDAGATNLIYDKSNNLLHKVTANIRDGLQENASIRYSYDKERLVSIDYPKNFQNKVQIHYGEPGAEHNRAGRIWLQQDGTGGREFFYDAFGNVTKEIRTIIINRSEIYTYVTEFEHDAFNRITKLIYPDGERVEYIYDNTSRLDRMVGTKGDDEYIYVDNIHYDQYLELIKLEYGNGVIDENIYDDKTRINSQKLSNDQGDFYNASLTYDLEDNILTFQNNQGNAFNGEFIITNKYDEKNRLTDSEGTWNNTTNRSSYSMFFDYNPTNTLSMKSQEVVHNDHVDPLKSRNFDYEYNDDKYPSRPSSIAGKNYKYDLNGNLNLVNSQQVFDFTQYVYDEENRMAGASINGKTSLYTYDAFGRRAIKSQGTIQGIFINGAPAGLLEHKKNYQVEVSPYFTVLEHGYRKHFFINNKRIISKIGTGIFNTNLSETPFVTAGSLDYKARIQAYENQILDYYANSGVPPGPPTLLALLVQPEFNQLGFDNLQVNNPYNALPPNWPQLSEPDSTGPPGSPVFFVQDDITNDNVQAGYNFTNGQITKELEQFYYHYDPRQHVHLITGSDGLVRQYKMYLPSGESWIAKALHIDSSSYAMAGYLLDEETGMYYMGEIYYDPVTNIDLSVDKIEQTFGTAIFNSRIEGDLYYDYADFLDDVNFDPQIINSEKPNPFIGIASRTVDEIQEDSNDIFTIDLRGESDFEKKRRKFQTQFPKDANSFSLSDIAETYEFQHVETPDAVEKEIPRKKKVVKRKVGKTSGENAVSKKKRKKRIVRKRKKRKVKKPVVRKT